MKEEVQIVGAGPGAVDLITVRGLDALKTADFVLYAGSLVNPEHLAVCKDGCITKDSANMSLEEQVESMAEAIEKGNKVVRLHTGDPAMYGAINEQISLLAKKGIKTKIVPGVSSVFGAAAALGCELTAPEISQSVVLTRTKGRTPMPEGESPAAFAKTKSTLVFFLSTGKMEELTKELSTEGELPLSTPVAVVYRATWPEERIIRGTLADIAQKVQEAGFGRQALIFVGEALRQSTAILEELETHRAQSKLYDKNFSHGYRNMISQEMFHGKCALYAFTKKGKARAEEIARGLNLPHEIFTFMQDSENKTSLSETLPKNWHTFDAHIFVGATGIAVRSIAPLLENKLVDPAVIACPESGSHIMSLTSGHIGGANRLARRIARITGGQAVISTASDVNALLAFDEAVAREQARILNPQEIKYLNAALLEGEEIIFLGKKSVFEAMYKNSNVKYYESADKLNIKYAIVWDYSGNTSHIAHVLKVKSPSFVLGIGCKKDTDYDLLKSSLQAFLQENSLDYSHIAQITSCTLKKDEDAILRLAKEFSLPLEFYDEEELNKVKVPNPSQKVLEKTEKTASVSEASALFALNSIFENKIRANSLYAPKTAYASSITFALARIGHGKDIEANRARMLVVGLGSGSKNQITPEVIQALRECDIVAGYTPYVDFIRDIVQDKEIIQNGMMGEVDRCTKALEAAARNTTVCMVCSGDPGILAMAGLLMELKTQNKEFSEVEIKVIPGITSANIAAASLGAPLQNGFCLVSLSDLLVPREEVQKNLQAVAQSALPIALYNPAGKKRRELMAQALEIFKEARGEDIYCAYVKNAGRVNETKWIGILKDFPQEEVDMSTLLIIGSNRTVFEENMLYEKRGYMDKYGK